MPSAALRGHRRGTEVAGRITAVTSARSQEILRGVRGSMMKSPAREDELDEQLIGEVESAGKLVQTGTSSWTSGMDTIQSY